MKFSIRESVMVYAPVGFMDSHTAPSIINIDYTVERIKVINDIKKDGIKLLLISFKEVVFFNSNGLRIILEDLKKVRKALDPTPLGVGICDYDNKNYIAIRRAFPEKMDFSLYETLEIAMLFTSNKRKEKDQNSILIWNLDYEQKNLQSLELFERDYTPTVVHNRRDFELHCKKDYKYVISKTYIGSVKNIIPLARISGNAVIYILDGYLDSDIGRQFDYNYHQKALKMGFKLFIFDMKSVVGMNAKVRYFFENLFKHGNRISIAVVNMQYKSRTDKIKDKLEKSGVHIFNKLDDLILDKALLHALGGSINRDIAERRDISKQLVNHLPNFVNSVVLTLEMMLNIPAIKSSTPKIQHLDGGQKRKHLASSIGFSGDLDGIIILIFPYNLAKRSCSMMLGEEIYRLSDVLDSLGELVNIIAGRVKQKFVNEKVNISITLPRTYSSLDDLNYYLPIKSRGVQMSFNFGQEEFTFFLTR
jgi:CheY-specific phosphatase CheX